MNFKALCFVDMPFGRKPDLKSGVVVDFDQIYNDAIKPAIEQCKSGPLGQQRAGEIIHSAMFPGWCHRVVLVDPATQCDRTALEG
jgi:hypothetical protein